jgi:predicted PurR-regulated permease PerM
MKHIIRTIGNNHPLTALIVFLFLLLLSQIREILVILFIAYILMASLSPFVNLLESKRVPHVIASIAVYLTTIIIVFLLIFPLVPFFINQLQSLLTTIPTYVGKISGILNIHIDTASIQSFATSELNSIGKNVFAVTKSIFSGLFSIISVLVIGFYLLLDRKNINQNIISFFPQKTQDRAQETLSQVEEKLGAWLRGQIVLSVFIGAITWIALTFLGINFALPLALIAGLLEIVPTIGPIISAIPALIVAFATSPELSIIVVFVYIGIQLLENNLLVPKIMEKAVGLNPIVIILAVGIGAQLMGVLGALLAIPFLSMLVIIVKNLNDTK